MQSTKYRREKISNFEYIKNCKQLTNDDKNNKVQHQATDCRKIFPSYITEKITSRIYKQLLQIKEKVIQQYANQYRNVCKVKNKINNINKI